MSRFTRLQKIVIGLITTLTIFGFVVKGLQRTGAFADLGYDAFTMMRYALIDNPVHTVKEWTNDFANLWSTKEENDRLRYQLSQQPQYEEQLKEEKRKNLELEELMALKNTLSNYTTFAANVLARDADSWNSTLTLDMGEEDGISKDMVVMSSKGVIGQIIEVSKYTCKVKLLTSEDRQIGVSVKISISDSASSEGVLESYDAEKGNLIVNLFNNNEDVKEDMSVITSGKGGLYPSGLLVGKVHTIEELNNSIGKTIYVTPAADFQNFERVIIIASTKE